ncbi:MAG: AAA family ATPase [Actinomycetota bacterium]|nr:AAA family ATPase [Actinomycetota bacterium]
MYVKALRLSGFKSFANPTMLEFEPGVNVIVGPNGSGKSNIADALSWVLGSQAPSTLRGGSMEDVIFAGSASKPKLGIAEVSLTLDNSSGILPLDLSEVTISRSTDRTGATEYRINGAACRLLDIAELLSDTGIGKSIHTVVGQGQLDAVLQARPEDRRHFIEEAAQIGKFRRRKDRAVRKIERVDDNLLRLNDVLVELRRAIKPLKRQATAAAQYSELVGRHRELRQRLTATELQRLQSEDATLDLESDAHRGALLAEELATLRAQLVPAAEEREVFTTTAERTQQVANRIGRSDDRFASLARLADERAARIAGRLAAETEEGYRERIRLLEAEQQRWSGEAGQLQEAARRASARVQAARERAASARTALDEAEHGLGSARSDETVAAQALVRAEGSEAAGRATVGAIEARVSSALERREAAASSLTADASAVVASEQDVRTLEAELDAVAEAAAAAETRVEQARELADGLRASLGASHADLAAALARVQALEEVQDLFAHRPEVVDRLRPLLESSRDRARVAGAAEEDAARIVARADSEVERLWQDVARLDDELRRLDALMSGAAERLAGARRRRESREIELAALDEELARSREALAEAERGAIEERAALPERRAQLEEMTRLREEAERLVVQNRDATQVAAAALSEMELEERAATERSLAAQLRLEEAEAGIADAQNALEGLEDLRSRLRSARQRTEQVREAALLAAERASAWARDAEHRAGEARAQAHGAERKLAAMRARERELTEKLDEVGRRRNEAEVRRAETRARTIALGERAMEEWGLSVDEVIVLEGLNPVGEQEAREEVERLDRMMRRLGAVNPNASDEYAELAERETFLENQIEDLRASKRDLMKVVREVDETIVQVFGEAFEDVAREFESVFQRLFPGGTGRLKLIDPDDVLTSGIDIEARPPGKNVRKLSLLSGGERSLVALAFLFAIFRSRPSPFYLLDEVEAALDDINLLRFLGLIDELEERAQVLIVTHQKRTMEAADVLYGVSMAKDGVSHVIAKRMEEVTVLGPTRA